VPNFTFDTMTASAISRFLRPLPLLQSPEHSGHHLRELDDSLFVIFMYKKRISYGKTSPGIVLPITKHVRVFHLHVLIHNAEVTLKGCCISFCNQNPTKLCHMLRQILFLASLISFIHINPLQQASPSKIEMYFSSAT
jgi:hypothetical protein